MNGYFTVRAVSAVLQPSERIALETRYVDSLIGIVGCHEAVRSMCLQAAAGPSDAADKGRAELALARKKAEADVRSHGGVPEDCEFVLEAWAAMDL